MSTNSDTNINNTPPQSPFVSSLYMEHTNQTYPDNINILTLESELDSLSLVIKHITRLPGTKRTFDIFPKPNEDVKAQCVFKLNIDEVQMLITKLQEFVNAYNEFHKFGFVVGEHTSMEPWEYDVDVDIKDTNIKDIINKSTSNIKLDKLLELMQED